MKFGHPGRVSLSSPLAPHRLGTQVTGRVAQSSGYRTCPEKCADMGHPGVTWNPLYDKTWCLCGEHTYDGKEPTVDEHLACCRGPLTEPTQATQEQA